MASSNIKIKRVCEWCGNEFYAQKTTTRYCCKKCNERAYKRNLRINQVKSEEARSAEQSIQPIKDKDYIDTLEASRLLGTSRMSIYNLIYTGKLKAAKLSSRMTFVKRADIDTMLDSHPYLKIPRKKKEEITEFYTTKEIMEKYGVSESWIFKVGKEKDIPKIFRMGKTYWSKSHIDKFIISNKTDESITEWYSVAELMEKFNMTQTAVYSFVHERNIPKKKVKREVYYSKKHVDIAKGIAEPEKVEYYTIPEAMDKFHMTRDQLYYYVKTFNVPKVKEGKFTKIAKKELDKVFSEPIIKLQ